MIKRLWARFRGIKVVVRDRELRVPTIPLFRFRGPGIKLKLPSLENLRVPGSMSRVVVVIFLLSGLFIGGAMYFSIAGITQAKVWPEAGASYALGSPGGTVGQDLPDEGIGTAEQRRSQTLQINLAAGVRLSELTLKEMDLGRSGLTTCLSIGRASGTTGWMYADEIKLTGVHVPSFDMANAEIATLTLGATVDGRTNSATLDSTIAEQIITSSRGSGSFLSEGSAVDRVIIELAGDATIGVLTIEGVKCSVGNFDLDYIKAGSFVMDSASRVGTGNGIDTADLVVNSTVKTRVSTDTMVEIPLKVQ
jgi:hypothetical protein